MKCNFETTNVYTQINFSNFLKVIRASCWEIKRQRKCIKVNFSFSFHTDQYYIQNCKLDLYTKFQIFHIFWLWIQQSMISCNIFSSHPQFSFLINRFPIQSRTTQNLRSISEAYKVLTEGWYSFICDVPCIITGDVLAIVHAESFRERSDPLWSTSIQFSAQKQTNTDTLELYRFFPINAAYFTYIWRKSVPNGFLTCSLCATGNGTSPNRIISYYSLVFFLKIFLLYHRQTYYISVQI